MCEASPAGVDPKVTNPKLGSIRRGGNLSASLNTFFQLPVAMRIEQRLRRTPKDETHSMLAM